MVACVTVLVGVLKGTPGREARLRCYEKSHNVAVWRDAWQNMI